MTKTGRVGVAKALGTVAAVAGAATAGRAVADVAVRGWPVDAEDVAAVVGMLCVAAALSMVWRPARHRAWRIALVPFAGSVGLAWSVPGPVEAGMLACLALGAAAVWACWDLCEAWLVGIGPADAPEGATVAAVTLPD